MRTTGISERRAQVILLVRAFEEADPEGLVLPLRERNKATRRALMVTGLSGQTGDSAAAWKIRAGEAVMRRARMLLDGLIRRHPAPQRIVRLSQLGSSTTPVVLAAALMLGLSTNLLGFGRQINLLALPLLGLLSWNLLAYLGLVVYPIVRRSRSVQGLAELLAGVLFKGAVWRRIHSSRITEGGHSPQSRIIVKAVMRFGGMWHRIARELLAARVRLTLHVGAMVMIAGAVVGMYVRGIAFAYRATWESTWFDAAQMQRLLGWILGPAAWILGVEIPDVAPLQGPGGSGDAAPWIHLYAVTALLVVGLPRGLLALYEMWRCRRLKNRLPLDLGESYYRRLFTAWRGGTRHVEILPYSYTPRPGAMAPLKRLLFDFFGARAELRLVDPLPYGAEVAELPEIPSDLDDESTEPPDREICLVVVFNLAQPPESEVHGVFLRELTTRVDTRNTQLLVVLDLSRYRDHIADRSRVRERVDAWSRVVHEAGLTALPLDLERGAAPAGAVGESTKGGVGEDLMGAVRAALWPDPDLMQTPS